MILLDFKRFDYLLYSYLLFNTLVQIKSYQLIMGIPTYSIWEKDKIQKRFFVSKIFYDKYLVSSQMEFCVGIVRS